MKEMLEKVVCIVIFLLLVLFILNNIDYKNIEDDEYANLVIFGDNIDSARKGFCR
jgi:hypothetical protein